MELSKTAYLAITLMEQHGLSNQGWVFAFNNRKNSFGVCNYRKKCIFISKPLSLINNESHVKNTILHEIAHALVGHSHGHDWVWKSKAIEIGCNGERCFDSTIVENPESKYIAVCNGCGYIHRKHRVSKKISSCGFCSGSRYNEGFKLIFVLNPKYK